MTSAVEASGHRLAARVDAGFDNVAFPGIIDYGALRGISTVTALRRPCGLRLRYRSNRARLRPPARVQSERSRRHQVASRERTEYETALSDRLLIVVTESDNPEPEWSHVEMAIQEDEGDD